MGDEYREEYDGWRWYRCRVVEVVLWPRRRRWAVEVDSMFLRGRWERDYRKTTYHRTAEKAHAYANDRLDKVRNRFADGTPVGSRAHALDPVDDTTTELDTDTVWSYRMVNRGQYAITRDGTDVAEILFHDRIPGTAAVLPSAAEALAKANHGRFVDPRNTPRSQR